jgi:hypothetical protein
MRAMPGCSGFGTDTFKIMGRVGGFEQTTETAFCASRDYPRLLPVNSRRHRLAQLLLFFKRGWTGP